MNNKRDILEIGDLFAFYENKPEIYEILSQSEDIHNTILKTILNDILFKDKVVLDLGAGTGRFSIPLSSQVELVCSLDISGDALKILKGKAKGKRVEVLKGNFGNIPLSDQSIDIVLSTWAFPASSLNTEADFKDILRVAKKKGKIIIVENYPGGEYYRIKKKFLLDSGTHCKEINKWLLAKGFKRKVVEILHDFRSKRNIEKVLSGQPPLEKIKDYLYKRNKTWFNLKASIFYGEKR